MNWTFWKKESKPFVVPEEVKKEEIPRTESYYRIGRTTNNMISLIVGDSRYSPEVFLSEGACRNLCK